MSGRVVRGDRSVLIVAGAQRSLSTSLAAWLGRHPHIRMQPNECLAFERLGWHARSDWLAVRARAETARGRWFGLKRPEIFHNELAGTRAARAFPSAAVVVVLRQPVERLTSALDHYQRLGVLPASATVGTCFAAWQRSGGATPLGQIVEYSRYARSVSRLSLLFQDPLVLVHDEVLTDPLRWLGPLLRQLPAPAALGPLPHLNPGSGHVGTAEVLVRPRGDIAYRWDATRQLVRRRTAVFRAYGRMVGLRSTVSNSVPPTPTPPLSHEVPVELRAVFERDLRSVEETIGRSLPVSWYADLAS